MIWRRRLSQLNLVLDTRSMTPMCSSLFEFITSIPGSIGSVVYDGDGGGGGGDDDDDNDEEGDGDDCVTLSSPGVIRNARGEVTQKKHRVATGERNKLINDDIG
ncbi:unnamed protein product [Litomosoides sigmodontis]|uniref:Uncharacterized protein n=1 Tax=Litomosoides sigmodontis TaxID=42156 RepID=A0A3P6UMK5_LITSI|nr:unnamed protein product [Litomosoides sigmodontis]